jgi:hypothetical protein
MYIRPAPLPRIPNLHAPRGRPSVYRRLAFAAFEADRRAYMIAVAAIMALALASGPASAQAVLPAAPAVPSTLEVTCPNFQAALAGTANSATVLANQDRQMMCALLYSSRRLQDIQAFENIAYLRANGVPLNTTTTPDNTTTLAFMNGGFRIFSMFFLYAVGLTIGMTVTRTV